MRSPDGSVKADDLNSGGVSVSSIAEAGEELRGCAVLVRLALPNPAPAVQLVIGSRLCKAVCPFALSDLLQGARNKSQSALKLAICCLSQFKEEIGKPLRPPRKLILYHIITISDKWVGV